MQGVLFDGITPRARTRRGPRRHTGKARDKRGRIIKVAKKDRCHCGRLKHASAKQCMACHKPKPALKTCRCGKVFQPKISNQRTCSKPCARAGQAHHNRPNKLPDDIKVLSRRKSRARASAIRFARGWRPQVGRWRLICERDDWVCWLCFGRIDPTLVPPHRLSGSMDHVIPLTQGGCDADWNLRAAHRSCNMRRGNHESVARFDTRV